MMKTNLVLIGASVLACTPTSLPTDNIDTQDSGETGEIDPGPSFEGVWESTELRFLVRDGGFDENGTALPEGQDYSVVLPSTHFCIEKWYLTVYPNMKTEFRIRYLVSDECTGGAPKADYVEESQWITNSQEGSVYVHPTRVESETGELPDPYDLVYSWYSGEGGFDLGRELRDFDSDGVEDDAQYLVFWRDLDV